MTERGSVPISIVIIAKNEEAQIAECLSSAAFAKDIVVVDDFSTDKTAEISKRYTDHILQRAMDVEGRHRNWAYAQAKYDWVFSLDADERISAELAQELSELMRSEPQHSVYSVPLRNYIGDYWIKHGGWYPARKDRFFNHHKFRYEETEVHPRAFAEGSHGELKNDMTHYSYRGFEDFMRSVNNQTTLEAKKWVNDKRKMKFPKACWRTVDRFCRTYIGKQGYRDGFIGLMVAFYAASYQILSYAKYWELKRAERKQVAHSTQQTAHSKQHTADSTQH